MHNLICGVDCHPGDALCNRYCQGKVSRPPVATSDNERDWMRAAVLKRLTDAEHFCTAYVEAHSDDDNRQTHTVALDALRSAISSFL